MDAFRLRNKVVGDYSDYIGSFLTILDTRIEQFVSTQLSSGVLWPDPLLQLSPAYQAAETVEELSASGVLHPLCGQIFRGGAHSLRLHQHQRSVLEIAAQGHNYVVTTGTGSGKSLTYMIPIFDHILRHTPEQGKVRAIIVYPMNALINSQEQALARYVQNLGGASCPVRFARYTGQEDDARKKVIQADPPHILLTNYVMLELMLTRPDERAFVEEASSALQWLVLDELHTYRGRQGADVALLVRRLRERCGNQQLQCIGTSATMSSGDTRAERSAAVAEVAGKIFGVPVLPEHVIDESLRWVLPQARTPSPAELRAALTTQSPEIADWRSLADNPLAVWIEATFGLREDAAGRLRRREPITLIQGAKQLALLTGVPYIDCARRLQELFNLGSRVQSPEGAPGFAFKLHQFFSQGGSVYATIEPPETRYLTLEGQHYAPGDDGAAEKLLYPLVFCRECGQEYYLCTYKQHERTITPRPPFQRDEDVSDAVEDGYLLPDGAGFWPDEYLDLLPDSWFKELKRGRELTAEYARFRPRNLFVEPDGVIAAPHTGSGLRSWFLPTPFLTCLRCGEVYSKRQRSDFGKLSRLSSEGRSTATTLLTLSAVTQMRQDPLLAEQARKLLSFTDNRQDASLQAGHFNDFVEVALLRSAIFRALEKEPEGLDHTRIARCATEELHLDEALYALESGKSLLLSKRNRAALQDLVEYRIYEDLRRGWRVNQPNLEQCGLLVVDYQELEAFCGSAEEWHDHSLLAATPGPLRAVIIRAILDELRRSLAINAPCLEEGQQEALLRRVRAALRDPWSFDDNEVLYTAPVFVLPGALVGGRDERSLGVGTSLARYLRARQTWPGLSADLTVNDYTELIGAIDRILRGAGYLVRVIGEQGPAVQLRCDALLWRAGEGQALARDPIRSRRMNLPYERAAAPNGFFAGFYRQAAGTVGGIEGREHTGQVEQQDREKREGEFREGKLAALFCSPTMELGIDIADLNVVHLRNVPPTPANYAQRSGRAGRSGQPAFVATYCAVGSGHDQYFFRRPERMVAGVVAPPRLDLGNEELVRAHVHAVWLATTRLKLGHSMIEVLDTANTAGGYPLLRDVATVLASSVARQQECLEVCRRILASAAADLVQAGWYSAAWLATVVAGAALAFDRACDRWRELYGAADRQLQEARAETDRRYQGRATREEAADARRRESEALRQKDLLCNTSSKQGDTDFNPYRYLASEGFLPGYNFPRLPVQAFLPTSRDGGAFLTRPRFLALTEFGPRNVIYHEGRKYRVTRTIVPAGSAESRLLTAKLCHSCGYFHEGGAALSVELCEQCGTLMDGKTSLTTSSLFEMTTVATQRIERITSEEEERRREGYHITSHYRFAPGRQVKAQACAPDQTPLLELTYAPATTLWRINNRWRRASTAGYTLDMKRGTWAKRPNDDGDTAGDVDPSDLLSGVRILVRDTRNVLLIQPESAGNETLLASLQFALLRGIETLFQIEEQELASERIGKETHRRIMLWEAAEGGVGVLRRLAEDPDTLAEVASAALEICHFDPETGTERLEEAKDCGRACYRCLLSYTNQPDHPHLDRSTVRDLLVQLSRSATTPAAASSAPAGHYETLLARTTGTFARQVLEYLNTSKVALPDAARPVLADMSAQPDFYYADRGLCLFCEDVPGAVRDELEDGGYSVLILKQDKDLEAQLERVR